jgi:hypothetical protein
VEQRIKVQSLHVQGTLSLTDATDLATELDAVAKKVAENVLQMSVLKQRGEAMASRVRCSFFELVFLLKRQCAQFVLCVVDKPEPISTKALCTTSSGAQFWDYLSFLTRILVYK